MTLSIPRVRYYLQTFNLEKLFIEELGWDRHTGQFPVQVDGQSYTLRAFAEKRGVQIFECQPGDDGKIPDYDTRRKIEKQVTRSAYEHLIIFTDATKTTQIWQWAARLPGQPAAYREHPYHPEHQSGDALIQKLNAITIPLNEEEALDLTGTVHKLRDAFDRDRVTKRFYDCFKKEHAVFFEFIKGITDQGDKEWYASLMLNRLMFVYFIQRKGFLDGDTNYLKNRLKAVQARKGKGKFLTFYRYFLLCLFHEGFSKQPAQRELSPDLAELLGDVPYLNGGLFELHELEQKHTGIDIPDEAFERLFDFFDRYEWHLDARPLRNDKEINPDVLGYIFEKYINQKQMGAYYTKEDITEYISENTIIPYLFDAAEKKCAVAFKRGSALWRLLQEDPDRYIYEPVRRGVIDEQGEVIPESALPDFVQKGMHDPKARMFERRYNLGEAILQDNAGRKFTLPTETWREYVNRRQRCLELREKLASGEIHQINDLITYNLNIRQFAEDVISNCEGPELLRAFYHAISTVTVLDPTCGSGAFLFAALNILEPLYEACLDRMQAFVDDLDRSGERHHPKKFEDFRRTLAEVEKRLNRTYFILKSIIVNNLYGVDIMEEAVEICKLRLFLKLVAQVDKVKDLEPLPDIDFNIRPGNTLIGFTSLDEIRRAAERESEGQARLVFGETDDALRRIEEDAEIVDRAFRKFREMQVEYGMDAREFTAAKRDLRERLKKLAAEFDQYLAREYGIDPGKKEAFEAWRRSYQPFHWFAEFYGIMHRGGFDSIIGNPPYVEWAKIEGYRPSSAGYTILSCGNIYTAICERSYDLIPQRGRFGMIVPISCIATGRMRPLRELWATNQMETHASFYSGDAHPSVLFNGVKFRLAILLQQKAAPHQVIFSTHFQRWYAEARDLVFPLIEYTRSDPSLSRLSLYPKISSSIHHRILSKLCTKKVCLGAFVRESSRYEMYCHRIVAHFVKAVDFVPRFCSERDGVKRSEDYKIFGTGSAAEKHVLSAVLNSSIFYSWFVTYSDVYHCGREIILDFPVDLPALTQTWGQELCAINPRLMKDLRKNSVRRKIPYQKTGLVEYDEFYSRLSKPIIDEIDSTLAQHYGFTDEELDFIINYDIKYRMGGDTAAGEEE